AAPGSWNAAPWRPDTPRDHPVRVVLAHQLVEPYELAALLDLAFDAGHHAAVRLGGLHDLAVKAFDLDVHVLVAQARQRADEVHRGVWIDAREAGVLVEVEVIDAQVEVEQAAARELQS